MAAQQAEPTTYRVDDLTIDVVHQRVTRDGVELPLSGLSFDLLLVLVREAPGLVTYDQLLDKVWPRQVVSLETVTQRVKVVREALGEDARNPRYLAAVRGRGYRLVAPVTQLHSHTETSGLAGAQQPALPLSAPVQKRKPVLAIAASLLVTIAAVAVFMARTRQEAPEPIQPAVAPDKSVAVLPFVNLSGEAQHEYFSDGLTEELLHRLASLPELRVPARTSSFQFKGKSAPAREIADALGVRYLLEGSVRESSGRLRVSVQLIDARTGYHTWSRTFDRARADVFLIQDEISLAVAEAMQITLLEQSRRALTRHATMNPEALDLFFRAKHLHQSLELDRMRRAVEYYEEAIRLDPGYSAAYVGLADVIFLQKQLAELRPEDPYLERIVPLLERALALDPDNGDARALLGGFLQEAYDFAGAERELRAAEAAKPNGEYVLRYLANFYMQVGSPPERALEYSLRAREYDPLNPWTDVQVGFAHMHMGDCKSALREFDRVVELHPTFWVAEWGRSGALDCLDLPAEMLQSAQRLVGMNRYGDTESFLAVAHARVGNLDEARAIRTRLDDPRRGKYWSPTFRAWVLTALGERDSALAALEDAYQEKDFQLPGCLNLWMFRPLHGEPRFQRVVEQLGITERVALARRM